MNIIYIIGLYLIGCFVSRQMQRWFLYTADREHKFDFASWISVFLILIVIFVVLTYVLLRNIKLIHRIKSWWVGERKNKKSNDNSLPGMVLFSTDYGKVLSEKSNEPQLSESQIKSIEKKLTGD